MTQSGPLPSVVVIGASFTGLELVTEVASRREEVFGPSAGRVALVELGVEQQPGTGAAHATADALYPRPDSKSAVWG